MFLPLGVLGVLFLGALFGVVTEVFIAVVVVGVVAVAMVVDVVETAFA